VFPIDVPVQPAGLPPIRADAPAALVAGSVWISAPQLSRQAPANGYCGLRIKSGEITLQGQATIDANGVVHIRAADILRVRVNTDPPAAAPPVAGPGADATSTTVTPPAFASIEFRQDGAHVTALDTFSTTVYGSATTLTLDPSPNQYHSRFACVLIRATSSLDTFAFATVQSQLWTPSGAPAIDHGGWALSVSQKSVPLLGNAPDAGSIAIALGSGVSAGWRGLDGARTFSAGLLLIGPARLGVALTYGGAAFTQSLPLWNETSFARRSTIEVNCSARSSVVYIATAGNELIEISNANITARLDRPVHVDGSRFDFSNLPALFVIDQNTSGFHVGVQTLSMPAGQKPFPLALHNALLQLLAPTSLGFNGTPDPDGVPSGTLAIQFPLAGLLPTLPDPYITPFSSPLALTGSPVLTATTTWADIASAQLSFSSPALSINPDMPNVPALAGLLDVSTAVDQFGILFEQPAQPLPQISVQGMDFSGNANGVALMTLPEISWEPMYSDGSDGSPPGPIAAQTDGRIGTMTLPNSVRLVPIAPGLFIPPLLEEAKSGSLVDAEITLPFGIYAGIRDAHAQYRLVRPVFSDGLEGGLQIQFVPPVRIGPINNPPDPGFDGWASTRNETYGNRVLGNTGGVQPANIFNAQFTTNVPIVRYDFSGHGASLFSDWRKTKPVGTSVIKVQFDVFVGRTAYEVVQLQAFIYPWGICVVRTITIDRHDAGGVLRHDSGWQAASDGLLQLPGAGPFQVQLGPLALVTAIHNIQDPGGTFTLDNVRHWAPVTFDANFVLASPLSVTGGTAGVDRLASSGITGFLIADVGVDATPADVNLLLANRSASGAVAGTVAIGATGVQVRAAEISVSCALSGPTGVLIAALRGSPVLPAVGSWSVAKRTVAVGSPPVPLDRRVPIPLIRNNAETTWRFADPSDILNLASPQNEYGLLQSTGTQSVYFPQPQMIPPPAPPPPGTAGPGFHVPQPPNLADVGALFNASGLFPDLRTVLRFQGASADLQASPNGVEIHGTIDTAAFAPRPLMDFDVVKVLVDYHDENGVAAKPKVDVTPAGWSIALGRITFALITPLGADPLLKIVADATASSSAAASFSNINIIYGGVLAPIESIFANLQQLAKFLPGGEGAELEVHFSGTSLTIREVFSLPRLPLGVGFLKDIALDIGMTMSLLPQSLEFTSGIGSPARPFHWLVSPLAGTGVVQVGVKDGALAVLIQAGIGAGLSIDVGIAEGAASVVIAVQVTITGSNLNMMVLLTAQASVDVLDGLASATLSLTAGLGVTPHPFPPRLPPSTKPLDSVTFSAAVGVGIHLTVCWLVHVDFDGYWQFSQTFDVPDIMSVIPV
jgi:hypothetical protein